MTARIFLALATSCFFVTTTLAQEKTNGPTELPIGAELAIIDQTTVGTAITVTVKLASNQSIVSNVTAAPGADPCPASKDTYAWAADTTNNFGECNANLPNPLLVELSANTLYDISFSTSGAALTIQFLECTSASTQGFHCPFGDGTDDLKFDLESTNTQISVVADQAGSNGAFQDVLGSGDWIMPYHAVAYCHAQSVTLFATCMNENALGSYHKLGFFASNETGSSYSLVNADMVVQNDHEWVWDDGNLSLTFAANTGIDLEAYVDPDTGGRLKISNGVTLNFSESGSSADDGLELLGEGTKVTFEGVTVNGGDLRMKDGSVVVFGSGTNSLDIDTFDITGDATIGDGSTSGTVTLSYNDFAMTSGATLTIESNQTIKFDGVDFTVPLGGTLIIEDNATLKFDTGKKLIIEGTLVANGTPTAPALLTDSGSKWGGLIYDSSLTSTVTGLKVEKVDNTVTGERAVITVLDGKLILKRSTILHTTQDTWWGIYSPYNAGDIELEKSYIEAIWGHGVLSQGPDNDIKSINSRYFQQGQNFGALSVGSGSDIVTESSEFDGYSGSTHGQALRATGPGSTVTTDTTAPNEFCGEHDDLLWADDSSTITASSQIWENSNDWFRVFQGNNATVTTNSSSLGAACNLGAQKAAYTTSTGASNSDSGDPSLSWALVKAAREARRSGSHFEALQLLQNALDARDDDGAVRAAISGLARVYKDLRSEAAIFTVEQMRSDPKFAAQATRDIVAMRVRNGDLREAASTLRELSSSHPQSAELFDAQLTLFYGHRKTGTVASRAKMLEAALPASEHQELILASAYSSLGLEAPEVRRISARGSQTAPLSVSAYPNPFNPTTVLSVNIPAAALTRAEVYDILGRRVAVLVDGHLDAGSHDFRFDATSLPSGVYVYHVTSGAARVTGTLNLVR